jgi:hypothetical protein
LRVNDVPRAYLFDVVRTIREDPARLNSADAEYVVTGEDGMDYVVKTTSKHPGIPASEWLAHNIADACGIPTPQYALIELNDGRLGFGSQWDMSAVTDQAIRNHVTTAIPGVAGLAAQFSAIYALDLIIHNDDRHLGNYFIVKTQRDYGVKAYDFSRALFYQGWPMPQLPLKPTCNTVSCYRSLQVGYPYDKKIGAELIRRVRKIPSKQIKEWLDDSPKDWISAARKAEVHDWWDDGAQERLQEVERGLNDGTLL